MKKLLLILIIPLLSFGQSLEINTQKAAECIKKNNYKEAIIYLTIALGIDSEDITSVGFMAMAQNGVDEFELSLIYSNKWLELAIENNDIVEQTNALWYQGLNDYLMGNDNFCDYWMAAVLIGSKHLQEYFLQVINEKCN
tara:strand:+ start:2133 stop:2552 length:420 start_codon:yes stop_codon:yes gene_type:complete